MAKRTVVWTKTAVKQRREILKYWITRNQTTTYAEKLIHVVSAHIKLIQQYPESFKMTEFPDTRVSPLGHFSIFYKVCDDKIIITAFWDNRQNLKKLVKLISEK